MQAVAAGLAPAHLSLTDCGYPSACPSKNQSPSACPSKNARSYVELPQELPQAAEQSLQSRLQSLTSEGLALPRRRMGRMVKSRADSRGCESPPPSRCSPTALPPTGVSPPPPGRPQAHCSATRDSRAVGCLAPEDTRAPASPSICPCQPRRSERTRPRVRGTDPQALGRHWGGAKTRNCGPESRPSHAAAGCLPPDGS